mmetsp:Transcript_1255/g.2008  ORF Transcript_1255/g.2008 Transcript_1255/m.2008 type:complete len:89 (-) Transcript_1255:655-921(-)
MAIILMFHRGNVSVWIPKISLPPSYGEMSLMETLENRKNMEQCASNGFQVAFGSLPFRVVGLKEQLTVPYFLRKYECLPSRTTFSRAR